MSKNRQKRLGKVRVRLGRVGKTEFITFDDCICSAFDYIYAKKKTRFRNR